MASSMLDVMKLIRCISGPRLKRLFYVGKDQTGTPYKPNKIERYADCVILAASFIASFAYHVTPIYTTYYIIRYGFPSSTSIITTLKGLSFIPLSITLAFLFRGIGRYHNNYYKQFLSCLNSARKLKIPIGPSEAHNTGIQQYDFDMYSYPITFRYDESTVRPRKLVSCCKQTMVAKIIDFPLTMIKYFGAHYILRRLVFPGSNGIINLLFGEHLSIGRAKLRRTHDGYRAKLLAIDNNCIDTMFVDRRGSPDKTAHGNKLMICCEGNAAYYELGIMDVSLQAGYSTLGWNHPGFGESTGLPFPDQEYNAIDVVLRYAVTRLKFPFEDIILFGWSIGGYAATCGAMSYPNIGGLILDATFDELFPLVKKQCPELLKSLAESIVKDYFNLNISEQACHYNGPITIIRREQDEMMTLQVDDLSTNRANYILIRLVQTRYPHLITDDSNKALKKLLMTDRQDIILNQYGVNADICKSYIQQYITDNNNCNYPWLIGEGFSQHQKTRLLLYMASQYMLNYNSHHCDPLPVDMLRLSSIVGNMQKLHHQ